MIITLATLIRDRAWILPEFLQHVYELDYPKDKMILLFLINDSKDESENILRKFRTDHKDEYLAIKIMRHDLGMPQDSRTQIRKTHIYHGLAQLRNEILQAFLKTDGEYLFSVDSDILMPSNTLNQLIKDDKDIVSAHIWNNASRTANNSMIIYEGRYRHLNLPVNQIMKVDLTGAIYLIKREVIASGARYAWSDIGEDAPFCLSAQRLGYELYTDTRIHCDHVMTRRV